MTTDARSHLTRIDRDECLELLAGDVVGRLALVDGGTPVVLPVNYALDGGAIVFRTAPGLKLEAGQRTRVSFEIDQIDRETRSGWSVLATGRLEEVTQFDARAWDRVRELEVEPWAAGPKDHWMRLVPDRITGRRIDPA